MFANFTGLGNYSWYILSLVSRTLQENENIIYSTVKPNDKLQRQLLQSSKNKTAISTAYFKSFWRSFGIIKNLKKDNIDLYHGLSNELPFGIQQSGIASVVTIHDLIFLRYPAYYSKVDRLIYLFKSRYACKVAHQIIAVSEKTKQDIIHFFKISPAKINVIYQDCDENFKKTCAKEEQERIRSKYHLPEKFLLNVGTIEARKNLLLILKALPLISPAISLVIIGKEKAYAREVKQFLKQNNLQDRVLFLKDVEFTDLPGVYQQSEIFVYPSKYEGFGIPIIEALHSGVPVIAATGSCLEEAGGEGSLYTDPDNFEKLAELIQMLVNNPDKRREMAETGKKHVQNFSDEIISSKLNNTYNKACADAQR